jgi:predicted HicB family RNase H-like nuclease
MKPAKKRPGAPIGSRNAAKPDGPVVSQIVFRCPPELKAAAVAKAAPESLSVWMVETVRRAVGGGGAE